MCVICPALPHIAPLSCLDSYPTREVGSHEARHLRWHDVHHPVNMP